MKKVINWFKTLLSKVQRLKNKHIPTAVKIVQGVKKAIDKGTVNLIVDALAFVLPDVGDAVLNQIERYLVKRIPALCVQLEIINAVNLANKDEVAIKQALDALSGTYGEKWKEFMSGLAGDLTNFLSDGVIDAKEAKVLASEFYNEYIKKQ